MGQPAARVGDPHVCPMVTGVVPHVGGPILPPGCPTVLIG
ncbi:MAG: type VI secretion protein, partial [Verrucomicrobia bacterium]|nr:type VI secretion protein [Verrucomicrobiota bacterium]